VGQFPETPGSTHPKQVGQFVENEGVSSPEIGQQMAITFKKPYYSYIKSTAEHFEKNG
jgi:hypothetical protein